MKLWICFLVFLLSWAAPVVSEYTRVFADPSSLWRSFVAFDLKLRCHEAECLVAGIDPYAVWSGQVERKGYVPLDTSRVAEMARANRGEKILHVYPPWSMAAVVPFVWLPDACRYFLFTLLETCIVAGLALFFFRRVSRLVDSQEAGLLVLAFGGLAVPNVAKCMNVGNYGIVIAGAMVLAIALMERRREWLAGAVWAVTMVKPQIGLIYFIVLCVLRRWKAVVAGGLVIGALTLVASAMCGTAPLEMVLSIRKYNSAMCFPGEGLVTSVLMRWLAAHVSASAPIAFGMLLGGGACIALTLVFVRTGDLLLAFLPAALLSTTWAAGGWMHDHSIDCVALMILGTIAFASRKNPWTLLWTGLVFLSVALRELGVSLLPIPNWVLLIQIAALFGLGRSLSRSC